MIFMHKPIFYDICHIFLIFCVIYVIEIDVLNKLGGNYLFEGGNAMEILKKLPFTCFLTIFLITSTSSVSSFDLIVPDTGQDLCYDCFQYNICLFAP